MSTLSSLIGSLSCLSVGGGRSNEVLVLVQARAGVASELSEEGAMDSWKVLFRGTNGWRRFVEDRIDT